MTFLLVSVIYIYNAVKIQDLNKFNYLDLGHGNEFYKNNYDSVIVIYK